MCRVMYRHGDPCDRQHTLPWSVHRHNPASRSIISPFSATLSACTFVPSISRLHIPFSCTAWALGLRELDSKTEALVFFQSMGRPKMATVIENRTGQGLVMKVRNPHCFVRMASMKRGEGYTMRLCTDWTFQEFVLEDKSDAAKKIHVNSDDCCDYERMTVKESEGALYLETVARKMSGGREDKAAAGDLQPCKSSMKKAKKRSCLCGRFWAKPSQNL